MNSLSKLSFLVMALALGACNEKVSPELQGAATTSTTGGSSSGGPAVVPEQFYFRAVNKSDTILNFKLHKTGAGNSNSNCEINSSTALTNNAYRADPATYDITCYYDAEELSLNFNGFSFAVEASQNTCEYIGYGAFSYFDRMPGSSSQSLLTIECAEDPASHPTPTDISNQGAQYAGMGCNTFRNTSVNGAVSFQRETDQQLCNFDYTASGGPNCDSGVISISGWALTRIDTDGNGTIDAPGTPSFVQRTHFCGGSAANCISGPYVQERTNANFTSGTKIVPSVYNTAYTKTYSYGPLFDDGYSNRKYVNYRRDLASLNIEFGNSNRNGGTTDLTNSYMSSFGDPVYKYDYNPELMALYSDNKRMNGTTLVTAAHQSFAAQLSNQYLATPLAAEPFVGLNGAKTNAFYSMYCFDNAFDVKARIRMVVRDFDRVFSSSPTDVSFARISDVDLLPPFARQDVPYTDEVTGDTDSWNAFNDIADWDDLIDMEREDGGTTYTPAITIWRTYPQVPYTTSDTNGFFNTSYFPNEE